MRSEFFLAFYSVRLERRRAWESPSTVLLIAALHAMFHDLNNSEGLLLNVFGFSVENVRMHADSQ